MQHALKTLRMPHAVKSGPMPPAPKTRMQHVVKAVPMQNAAKAVHEKVLRCRKCFRSGGATWETTSTGSRALLALSEGFHRRARVPLSLPPEIVCDCGMAQPEHD
jgi:hypothetical protein